MEHAWIGGLFFVVLLVFLALGINVGVSLILAGFLGLIIINGFKSAMGIFGTTPFATVSNFTYTSIPMFVLMGMFAAECGMAEAVYRAASRLMGRIPGGLGIATMLANVGFGAVCGSSVAATAVFAKVAYPEMKRYGYDTSFACGITGSCGIISMLIPPSVLAIVVGILTSQSIGKLLIAGIGPGITIALFYSLIILVRARLKPSLAPPLAKVATWKEKMLSVRDTWPVVLLAVIVLAGIYMGVFTPTEAGAVGAGVAFLMGAFGKRLSLSTVSRSLVDTLRIVAMLFLIIIGAMIFSRFQASVGTPGWFARLIVDMNVGPTAFVLLAMFMYLVLGCFLESLSTMAITLPLVFPISQSMGLDPYWFLTLSIVTMELGLLTPPVGNNVYAVKAAVGDAVPIETIFRGVFPYAIGGVVAVILLMVFPSVVTFLPNAMMQPP